MVEGRGECLGRLGCREAGAGDSAGSSQRGLGEASQAGKRPAYAGGWWPHLVQFTWVPELRRQAGGATDVVVEGHGQAQLKTEVGRSMRACASAKPKNCGSYDHLVSWHGFCWGTSNCAHFLQTAPTRHRRTRQQTNLNSSLVAASSTASIGHIRGHHHNHGQTSSGPVFFVGEKIKYDSRSRNPHVQTNTPRSLGQARTWSDLAVYAIAAPSIPRPWMSTHTQPSAWDRSGARSDVGARPGGSHLLAFLSRDGP